MWEFKTVGCGLFQALINLSNFISITPIHQMTLTLNQELDIGQFDESVAVDLILESRQMSFRDINFLHGSNHNTSSKLRAGYVLQFMPTSSNSTES